MRNPRNDPADVPVRRCILSGDRADARLLIRLAVGPDGTVLPDIQGKAPGRGAWLGVTRAMLEDAIARGKLRSGLGRAFKGAALTVPDDLPDRIAQGLERATLDRLGLEARSGFLLTGTDKINTALRQGQVSLLLHASDSRPDGVAKLAQAWRVGLDREGSGETGLLLPVDRNHLSMALGRNNAVHVALIGSGAALRVLHHLERWLYFSGCSMGARPELPSADAVPVSALARHDIEGSDFFDE